MKFKSIVSVLLICLILCSCSMSPSSNKVTFYYCKAELQYDSPQGILATEVYRNVADPLDYAKPLEAYLEGPKTSNLNAPVPSDVKLIGLTTDQQTAHVTLNRAFADLTGVDLSIACICISMTVKSITGCPVVQIEAQDAMLDNRKSITIDTNTIQFSDLNK